jgi:hypothetical protein
LVSGHPFKLAQALAAKSYEPEMPRTVPFSQIHANQRFDFKSWLPAAAEYPVSIHLTVRF